VSPYFNHIICSMILKASNGCFLEDDCRMWLLDELYSAYWYGSVCYVTFMDSRVTWYDAASRCVDVNGSLASFDIVNTTSVKIIRGDLIPPWCVWIGLTKNYIKWIIPQSQSDFFTVILGRPRVMFKNKCVIIHVKIKY